MPACEPPECVLWGCLQWGWGGIDTDCGDLKPPNASSHTSKCRTVDGVLA